MDAVDCAIASTSVQPAAVLPNLIPFVSGRDRRLARRTKSRDANSLHPGSAEHCVTEQCSAREFLATCVCGAVRTGRYLVSRLLPRAARGTLVSVMLEPDRIDEYVVGAFDRGQRVASFDAEFCR